MVDTIRRLLREVLRDDSGAVLAEYALVLSGLTIGGILAFELIGTTANNSVATDEKNFTATTYQAP